MRAGSILLPFYKLKALTLRGVWERQTAGRQYLHRILEAPPIPAHKEGVEVHMLLNHRRIWEGLWALYSFAYFCDVPCRLVVHSDGSLTEAELRILNRIFPGLRVISKSSADQEVSDYLGGRNLRRLSELRRNGSILMMKIIDSWFFSESSNFIVMDSDVLFFDSPRELISNSPANLYMMDNSYRYLLEEHEFEEMLGRPCLEKVNSGVIQVEKERLNFETLEKYLGHPVFTAERIEKGRHYLEQTLWAMEMTQAGGKPLPDTYALCPDFSQPVICGHFCGWGYPRTFFYTRGLPRLASVFLNSDSRKPQHVFVS